MKVWVAVVLENDGNEATFYARTTEAAARKCVADWCRDNWESGDDIGEIPETDDAVIEKYFDAVSDGDQDQTWHLDECEIKE